MSEERKRLDRLARIVKGLIVAWPLVFFGFCGAWLLGYDVTLLEARVDRSYRQKLDLEALVEWADPILVSVGNRQFEIEELPPLPEGITCSRAMAVGASNLYVRLRLHGVDARSSGWVDVTLRDEKTSPEVRRIVPRVFRIPRL